MSNIVIRPVGYTGATEEIIWADGDDVQVTAYLWGGGGGRGGLDSSPGGTGSGGGFSLVNFTINEGDSIKVAVGGGGGYGATGARGFGGGSAGASFTITPVFDTRSAETSPTVYPQFNSSWCAFLNTYGIWVNPSSATYFDRTWTVNFPVTGAYTFTMSADNLAELRVDGTARFYSDSFTQTFEQVINLSAGSHIIRIIGQNTGGPGGVALTISGGSSYSGGRGGNAGANGTSGAGGGGAGATVLYLNSTLLAVAGGGGGGGNKIICQKLAEMGFFDSAMNAADQQFGIMLRDQDPDAYNGYLRWAQPVVDLLEGKGSVRFRKIVFFWVRDEQRRQQIQSNIVAHYLDVIARPWAEEMAYRMKAEGYGKSNTAGRFIMNIGLPMCRAISRFGKRRELPMWLKTVLIWGTTTLLLVAVTAISTIDKTRKLFKGKDV